MRYGGCVWNCVVFGEMARDCWLWEMAALDVCDVCFCFITLVQGPKKTLHVHTCAITAWRWAHSGAKRATRCGERWLVAGVVWQHPHPPHSRNSEHQFECHKLPVRSPEPGEAACTPGHPCVHYNTLHTHTHTHTTHARTRNKRAHAQQPRQSSCRGQEQRIEATSVGREGLTRDTRTPAPGSSTGQSPLQRRRLRCAVLVCSTMARHRSTTQLARCQS